MANDEQDYTPDPEKLREIDERIAKRAAEKMISPIEALKETEGLMLHQIHALHYEASCSCGARSEKLCSADIQASRVGAIERLRELGWTHKAVPLPGDGDMQRELAERYGSGEWFCPACSAKAR